MSREMYLPGLIFFTVVVFISITTRAENSEPYCKLYTGNSTAYPKPMYECFKYKNFPVHLNNTEEIKTLYLNDGNGSNNLQVLKKDVLFASKTTNLEALLLIKCEIKEIEKGAFRGGSKVTQLNLYSNLIEELDLNVFEDLPNLQELWLHHNPLASLYNNSTFPRSKLTMLHLSNCKLRSINANIFENLVNLKELYIHGNLLTTINWNVFRPLNNLQRVCLDGNPFHCDCQIKFLLDYLQKRNIRWDRWMDKPNCSSTSFDDFVHIPSAEKWKQQVFLVDWNSINRQHLLCPPQVSSLQKSKDMESISTNCKYSGFPEPTVIWRIDGEILQIDNRNKQLIETKAIGDMKKPAYNYEYIQTLFVSNLPFSTNRSASQVTCQASSSVFKSTESNAVTVNFPRMETATVTSTVNSKLWETSSPVSIGMEGVPTNQENSMQATVFIIIGAVAGLAVILIVAIFVAIRCRKTIPFYKFLPQRDPQPPVEDNPTGHVYDYIRMSWIRRQEGDGYETPISLSIQHVPLPPLPQQQNPGDGANKTN